MSFIFSKVQTLEAYGCMHLQDVQACDWNVSLKVAFLEDCEVQDLDFEIFYKDYIDSDGEEHHDSSFFYSW